MMYQRRQKGFSLLEMVIVLAIFSLTSLIATEIFLTVSKNQRRFTSFQSVESDTRYVENLITRSIQFGSIDYDFYEDPDRNPNTEDSMTLEKEGIGILALRDEEGKQILFRKKGSDDNPWDLSGTFIEQCFNDGNNICVIDSSNWKRLNAKQVNVEILRFFISPTKNPWLRTNDGRFLSNKHPRVTFIYRASDAKNPGELHLQTTIATRFYER